MTRQQGKNRAQVLVLSHPKPFTKRVAKPMNAPPLDPKYLEPLAVQTFNNLQLQSTCLSPQYVPLFHTRNLCTSKPKGVSSGDIPLLPNLVVSASMGIRKGVSPEDSETLTVFFIKGIGYIRKVPPDLDGNSDIVTVTMLSSLLFTPYSVFLLVCNYQNLCG